MATPAGTDATRAAGYPLISEAAWWQVRKLFQTKGMPKVFDVDYLITAGMRDNKDSAANIVRPLKRYGLFSAEGKPEDRGWDWIEDEKYPAVCGEILHEVYPEALTDMFTSTSDADRAGVERWFQRNLHLAPNSARQYAGLYMLLLDGDPSKQEASTSAQPAKQTKQAKSSPPTNGQTRAQKPRAAAAAPAAQVPLMLVPEHAAPAAEPDESAHVKAPRAQHGSGGFEPTLNINVQIHIPAEASPDQIDQIFKSMATHLYRRRDEASE